MALQILENNGAFQLKGIVNATTTRSLIIKVEHVFKKYNKVSINNDQVSLIDQKGVEAFKTLMSFALKNNYDFSILGKGSKDLYEDFHTPLAA
jgi:hypothetical protein